MLASVRILHHLENSLIYVLLSTLDEGHSSTYMAVMEDRDVLGWKEELEEGEQSALEGRDDKQEAGESFRVALLNLSRIPNFLDPLMFLLHVPKWPHKLRNSTNSVLFSWKSFT